MNDGYPLSKVRGLIKFKVPEYSFSRESVVTLSYLSHKSCHVLCNALFT